MTGTANQLWVNEALMKYLKTGRFTYKYPFGKVEYEDPDGKPGCDFFGINHYARYSTQDRQCSPPSGLLSETSLINWLSLTSTARSQHWLSQGSPHQCFDRSDVVCAGAWPQKAMLHGWDVSYQSHNCCMLETCHNSHMYEQVMVHAVNHGSCLPTHAAASGSPLLKHCSVVTQPSPCSKQPHPCLTVAMALPQFDNSSAPL